MDGLGRRTGGKGGKKKKGFEKEGGVGGERMPTTPPPLQCCCDTRARVPPRERDVAERERELHGEWKEDTEEEREKNWDPR